MGVRSRLRRRRPVAWPGRRPTRTPVGTVAVTIQLRGVREVTRALDDLHITTRVLVAGWRYRKRHPDAPAHHVLAVRAAERIAVAHDIAAARLDTLQRRFAAHPTMEEAWNAHRSLDTSTTSPCTATARRLWQRLRRRPTTEA